MYLRSQTFGVIPPRDQYEAKPITRPTMSPLEMARHDGQSPHRHERRHGPSDEPTPAQDAMLEAVRQGPAGKWALVERSGTNPRSFHGIMSRLQERGLITMERLGPNNYIYRMAGDDQ